MVLRRVHAQAHAHTHAHKHDAHSHTRTHACACAHARVRTQAFRSMSTHEKSLEFESVLLKFVSEQRTNGEQDDEGETVRGDLL